MKISRGGLCVKTAVLLISLVSSTVMGEIVVCEGERFTPLDAKGWQFTAQNDSYASHTYGGMWMTHGAGIGAPADSEGSVAVQEVTIPSEAEYRVWSKYQAPPYFNYLHKIEIVQRGKVVFAQVYGKKGADRMWSFSTQSDELWWTWGVDHDTAEAPKKMVKLSPGKAQVRLITVANESPAGDRFIDFVILTTNPADDYEGRSPYRVVTPFGKEALAATELYIRFKNSTAKPAKLKVSAYMGHWQPNYSGWTIEVPQEAVAPGSWSAWTNIGPHCRLVHDEGVRLILEGAETVRAQLARDPQGKDMVGEVTVPNGDTVTIPLNVTWNKDAEFIPSKENARRVIAKCKTEWRTANKGKKPQRIAYYGSFGGAGNWWELKDALGYNTHLPKKYDRISPHAMHTHSFGAQEITALAKRIRDKDEFRLLSFGDEISLGSIDFNDPEMQKEFRIWLKKKGYTREDLGVAVAVAKLTQKPNTRLAWYSQLFNEEQRFAYYRSQTKLTEKLIGRHVLTGANYSPHHLALCYGPIYQWVDLFKHNGMSMFWAEDYIFSVPEVPQIFSWMLAETKCGVKYNDQPMLYYIMPHAPGQEAGYLRRDMLAAIGFGVSHINSFTVAPEENHTENYVTWGYDETFRVLHESIYDSGEVEDFQAGGKQRPARVAVVLSKATDYNESRLAVNPKDDPFLRQCRNAQDQASRLEQTICRKDQQMLYLALRHGQHGVELITEDDIVDGYLKQYDVVYFAGEWIDHRAVGRLKTWVKRGGILYATAGIGHLNEFGEPEASMMELLGLKSCTTQKNLHIVRTLLELPLAEPIGTITMNGQKIPAIGMKQKLVPATAKVLGKWEDGCAAVTVNTVGKGKAFAVGTLAGNTYMKTGLKQVPFARGGTKNLYNPVDFDAAATKLVRLGVEAGNPPQDVVCSNPYVEALVIDNPNKGTLLTLVNWSNGPIKDLQVRLKLAHKPKFARSVSQQSNKLPISYAGGVATITTDLTEADFILLPR